MVRLCTLPHSNYSPAKLIVAIYHTPTSVYPMHTTHTHSTGGYDPVMELEKASHAPAAHRSTTLEGKKQEDRDNEPEEHIQRREQHLINKIMRGEEKGHYYLILGPKGSGKTSMMIQAVSPDNEECGRVKFSIADSEY